MIKDTKSKKSFSDIEKPYTEFKGKMAVLRKNQTLILNNFSQKTTTKKINQIKKSLFK
jgi:hypothetical protein